MKKRGEKAWLEKNMYHRQQQVSCYYTKNYVRQDIF